MMTLSSGAENYGGDAALLVIEVEGGNARIP